MVGKKDLVKSIALFLIVVLIGFGTSWDPAEAKSVTDAEKRQAMIKSAKEILGGTTWDINLTQMTPDKKKDKFNDILTFSEGRISSEKLSNEDFGATNFTVRIKGEDIIIWETMQTSADKEKGVAFWRGEIRKEGVMRGVLSWHIKENKVKDYSFKSEVTLEEILTAPVVVEEEIVVVEEVTPEVEKTAEGTEEEAAEEAREEVKKEEKPAEKVPEETKKRTSRRRRR